MSSVRQLWSKGSRFGGIALTLLGAPLCIQACSEGGFGKGDADDSAFGDGGDGDFTAGDGDGDSSGEPPPEVELEETFRAPVVSGPYLWSANPETNKVARVNAATLEIEVLEGGHAPTYLAALPVGATGGGALVLNELSNDASFFALDEQGAVASHTRLPVQQGASAWAVGSIGNFAVAWSRATENLLNDGDGYQDLTVLDFRDETPRAIALSVGFRPSQVVLNEDETRAYVVSDPGISVIQLGDEVGVIRELFLPESEPGQARDVSFTPDGGLAIVRLEGEPALLLVDTESNERVSVAMPGPVTDLDLSGDGTTAVAVVRGGQIDPDTGMGGMGGTANEPPQPSDSMIALLPTETLFAQPTNFTLLSTSEVVGSVVVADDASRALLFTNATNNHHVTILDIGSGQMRVEDLKAPVQAAFLSEGGEYSVVLMAPPLQSTRQGAFALLPVAEDLSARIKGTNTPPEFVSISAEASRVLVTTKATATERAVTYFGRFPGGQIDEVELPSKPLASGLVPEAGQGFVAQEHPEGRVTFISLETGIEKTVTGFELSSKVVD